MIQNILYIILGLIMYSCVQDSPLSQDSQSLTLNSSDISWFYDIDSQELLIQIDVNNIGSDMIEHMYIRLSDIDNDFYEIFDNGQNGDVIENNGVYSILFNSVIDSNYTLDIQLDFDGYDTNYNYQYAVNFNAPSIIDDSFYPVIPSEHILDQDEVTFFNMVLAVEDLDGYNDIEFVRFYVKKIAFFDGSLVNGACDYDVVESDEYSWDPTWEMAYIGNNSNGQMVFNSTIPMNPIQSSTVCGGFGDVQFKFEVRDNKGFSDTLEIDEIISICPGVCE